MPSVQLGSKEYLIVDLVDTTGATTSLAALGAQFKVYDGETGDLRQGPTNCVVSSMRAQCLVDTTIVGFVAGRHVLHILLTSAGLEAPVIFAGEFQITDVVP